MYIRIKLPLKFWCNSLDFISAWRWTSEPQFKVTNSPKRLNTSIFSRILLFVVNSYSLASFRSYWLPRQWLSAFFFMGLCNETQLWAKTGCSTISGSLWRSKGAALCPWQIGEILQALEAVYQIQRTFWPPLGMVFKVMLCEHNCIWSFVKGFLNGQKWFDFEFKKKELKKLELPLAKIVHFTDNCPNFDSTMMPLFTIFN